jgi:predicted CoA-substrate-specific enzyme activase
MISVGIDVGAETLKLAVLEGKKVFYSDLWTTEEGGENGSLLILERALQATELKKGDIGKVIATGIGRKAVVFADEKRTDAICHVRGARRFFPTCRTVLDVGAQGTRALRVDPSGKMVDFAENAKCAAGSGFFLELMGKILGVPLDEIGVRSLSASKTVEITNFCSVFAESEVISMIHSGESADSILAGLHHSLIFRFFDLLMNVGVKADLVMTGGGARNSALVRGIENLTAMPVLVPPDPQLVGAIGAAILGQA